MRAVEREDEVNDGRNCDLFALRKSWCTSTFQTLGAQMARRRIVRNTGSVCTSSVVTLSVSDVYESVDIGP
jgi:hypothetical protein